MTKPLCLHQVNTIFWLFPGRPQGCRGQGPPRHLTYTLKEWLVLWAPGTPCWHSKPTCPRCMNSHGGMMSPYSHVVSHTQYIYIYIILLLLWKIIIIITIIFYYYYILYIIYIYIACCSLIDVFDAETHNIPQQQHSPLQNAETLTNAAKILFQPELASCGSSCRWNPTRSTKSGTIWPKFNLIVSKLFN